MKNKLNEFKGFKISLKIFSVFLIFVVLISCIMIPTFAADESRPVVYQTLAPLGASFAQGDYIVEVFPNTSDPEFIANNALSSSELVDYLTSIDYTSSNYSGRLKFMSYNGAQTPYIEINVACSYSHITVNGQAYQGSTSVPSGYTSILPRAFNFFVNGPSANYVSGSSYYYSFAVILFNVNGGDFDSGYRDGYYNGYAEGVASGTSSAVLEQARQDGYNEGYAAGRDSTDSENLGQNLLGDTLSAPMDALNDFTIYKSSSGFEVTLGLVVGGLISLTLFIAFLKIFAGG